MPKVLSLSAAALATLGLTFAAAGMTKPAGTAPSTTPHTMSKEDMMKRAYQPYTKAAFDAAKGTQRVLFFHATWCPNCKKADADITAGLKTIPAGVTVFKTDYDRESVLKKMYGITSQHSFVLVDAQGKALKKWSGGGLKDILAAAAKKM